MVTLALLLATAPASAEVYRYVARDPPREVAITTAPLPGEMLAAASLTTWWRFRDRAAGKPSAPVAAPAAASSAAAEPSSSAGWPSASPLPPRVYGSPPPAVPPLQRVAALHVRTKFTVGPERPRVRVLRLRARYEDGLAAWINGQEVVRRDVDGKDPYAFAQRRRGPEWETFYIPVRPGLLRDGENLLELEVRPSSVRLRPTLELELEGAERGRIVRGPIVQRVGPKDATIVVETDLPVRAEIAYGPRPEELTRVAGAGRPPSTRHEIPLGDLHGGPVYYQVLTDEDRTPVLSFHPAPAPGEPIRFAVYGDVRNGHDVHASIVAAILAEAPDFVIFTGDMVMRGSDEADWQKFFEIASPLLARIPVYPAIGNHDLGETGDRRRRFEDIFSLWPGPPDRAPGAGWYAFRVGDVEIVVLDSNRYADPAQLAWLDAELSRARARGPRAIFVATHDGPFSRGPHGGNELAATLYVPLLRRHGVAALFAGHDHIYQRGVAGGLPYVVSGGGGAPLYPITCGVPGRRRCAQDDGAVTARSVHHYVMVEVYRDYARLCPRLPDGTPLEECFTISFAATSASTDPAAPGSLRPTTRP